MFRNQFYQKLAAAKETILRRCADSAREIGMRDEWRGDIGLTGSNSARPSYLRRDVLARLNEGARSSANIVGYIDRIRELVKEVHGNDYDAVAMNSCEATLWASLETFAAPPIAGRGDNYRARYVGLYEGHIEHHLSYGRPWPPKYKDIFADRTNVAGELGVLGRRLHNLDVAIVPVEGVRYDVHGIKQFVTPLMTRADPEKTKARLDKVIERNVDTVSAIVSLGYDTTGYGYGAKSDGETSDLKRALGDLARDYDVPYIVDNARGIPFIGPHPESYRADLVLYSMDKVAGAITSGLVIGRESHVIPLQRAMGFHTERFGNSASPYGKGAMVAFDLGREALVSQVAALEWIRANGERIHACIDELHDLTVEALAPVIDKWGDGIMIERTYNGGGVEINYTRTWDDGAFGIPIFCTEDKAAGMNLLSSGVAALGILPPSCDEGNITITPGRGLVDEEGNLLPDRTRVALRGLAKVLTVLQEAVRG